MDHIVHQAHLQLLKKVKNKNGEFYLKETTKGSKKKVYGPYLSKKKIVQKGGDPRKEICKRVLILFINGSNESKRVDDNKHSFEKAFTVLEMNGFYSNRYEILSKLINCRSFITDPRISDLICGGDITLTETEIGNEARFYNNEEYKELIGPKLTKENWINFINYLHLCTFKTPIFILRKNGLKDSSLIYYT